MDVYINVCKFHSLILSFDNLPKKSVHFISWTPCILVSFSLTWQQQLQLSSLSKHFVCACLSDSANCCHCQNSLFVLAPATVQIVVSTKLFWFWLSQWQRKLVSLSNSLFVLAPATVQIAVTTKLFACTCASDSANCCHCQNCLYSSHAR